MAKYFKPEEFRRCTPACSIDDMDATFLNRLDELREKAGIPLIISSAFRTKDYEKSKGRSGTSSHCEGKAVDIICGSSQNRYKIVKAAIECGFTRIGIAKTYIHVDACDDTHAPRVIWDYYK